MVVPTPALTNPVPTLSTGCIQHIPVKTDYNFNKLNHELKPICHLLALLGAHHILHVRVLRVKTQ